MVDQLDTYASAIRARLGVDTLGVSLWLPPTLAAALAADGRARTRLRSELDARGLEVRSLSGVPFAEGGGEVIGEDAPDWSDPARLEYTLDLARVLVDLLPDDAVRGAVTTLGLGRRDSWGQAQQQSADRILGRLSAGLAEVAWHTGRAVRVGFRPEPGFLLDSAASCVAALAKTDRDRVGVCLDTADLACTWQDPVATIDELGRAGISVIRVQVAAALETANPVVAADTLRRYVDDHRHPVTTPDGGYADHLSEALRDLPAGAWRIRYHMPLHLDPAPPLAATTSVCHAALMRLVGGALPETEHVDVAIETWGLLPPDQRPAGDSALADGIAAELTHVGRELSGLGLVPSADARA
ncbi:sugar phosphate isomerase/epimerase family protein [Mangrovihabitans endophyticus]|uniref:sugar phosphate isomerase/epimerase family protein n=1 Tax=Mangrovihabitans endophyticus TaxID=1751298 RepID=UPI00166D92CE|nr:TIM barrel protein [Mangrovihabitans endophyticus]